MSDAETPIACTLDGKSYVERLGDIRALFARALKTSRRDGPRLHLTFDSAVREEVWEMVRKEEACCPFLGFQLADGEGEIKLTITVPPGAADGADDLLAPFSGTEQGAACGCSPNPASRLSGFLTKASLGAGGVTLLCGTGCALAVVLASVGVGSTWLTNFEVMQSWWLPTFAIALLTLGAAWFVRHRSGGSRTQLRALQIATALVFLGAISGWLELAGA